MKRSNQFLGFSIMFFVFAVVFSIIFWPDRPLSAHIALFALGFGSGAMAIRWLPDGLIACGMATESRLVWLSSNSV